MCCAVAPSVSVADFDGGALGTAPTHANASRSSLRGVSGTAAGRVSGANGPDGGGEKATPTGGRTDNNTSTREGGEG